jgi:hypothetical protein
VRLIRTKENNEMYLTIRALPLSAALAVIFASTSMANIVGSTYNFSGSTTGATSISAVSGSYTDPANAGFCVGPPLACGSGAGLSGGYSYAQVTPTLDTITFSFFGSTAGSTGTFSIDLGNFHTLDGSMITGVTYASGNIGGGFTNVNWNGTDARFTSGNGDFNAIGGAHVVFDVAVTATPEPRSIALLLMVLAATGLIVFRKWRVQ